MDGWMNGWMDGRMDGWMDGWMDGMNTMCTVPQPVSRVPMRLDTDGPHYTAIATT